MWSLAPIDCTSVQATQSTGTGTGISLYLKLVQATRRTGNDTGNVIFIDLTSVLTTRDDNVNVVFIDFTGTGTYYSSNCYFYRLSIGLDYLP